MILNVPHFYRVFQVLQLTESLANIQLVIVSQIVVGGPKNAYSRGCQALGCHQHQRYLDMDDRHFQLMFVGKGIVCHYRRCRCCCCSYSWLSKIYILQYIDHL